MMTLVSGVLTEDFNYGYPYGANTQQSPPYFSYSGSVEASNTYTSSSYRRTDFRLQYLSKNDDPLNTDFGAHGGASLANPYYFMWPLMGWNDCQILNLQITLDANATMTYDRSFDGYVDDIFLLVVNGKEIEQVTHTAGYSWTTSEVSLSAGVNDIYWVLQTGVYNPTVLRNGLSQDLPSGSIPNLPRYMRMTNLVIQ
jgi:hypothetical protein